MALREPRSANESLNDKLNEPEDDGPEDTLRKTLKDSITSNGLIPEQLKTPDESQKPRRDSLLHVPFEVLYLLLHLSQQKDYQLKHPPTSKKTNKPADEASDNLRRLDGTVPFNDQIDERSIINLKEEWLYNYPSFLGFEPLRYGGKNPI